MSGLLSSKFACQCQGKVAANLQSRLHLHTQDQRCSKPANSGQEFRQRRAFVQWHHKGKSPVDEPRARQKRKDPDCKSSKAAAQLQVHLHASMPVGFGSFAFLSFFLIGIQLIFHVVLISAIQQSDLGIYTFFLYIRFHHGLSQDIGYSSLRYTVAPC